ncbi:hypothetical protein M405DRAFT_536462 [Rhizopogon salebrosus TDB-379]|nr:hypothetical protein M405DRAFT_536462 [Rhizopogon salebrosus TDB-379]
MARLPSARFATLCNCLRAILNGLSSISNLALYRRLFDVLLNFLLSYLSRKPPCSISRPFQPAGGPPSPRPSVPSAITASNLPGSIPTAPTIAPGNIGLQPQSHPQVPMTTSRRMPVPFVASTVQRYGKDMRIESSRGTEIIQPIVRQYPERQLPISTEWEAYVHPEGTLYFYHPQKRVFTDTDVQEDAFLIDLNACTDDLLALARSQGVYLTNNIELTIQLGVDVDAGEKVCSYYFADRAERTLFWLHELGTGDLFDGVRGVNEPSHIRYAIQFQYW